MIKVLKDLVCSSKGKGFILGAAAVIVGEKVLKNNKTREMAVNGVAKAMKFYSDTNAAIQNIKEEATDICYEAKLKEAEEDMDDAEE